MSIAVAERGLPSWAGAARLTCGRAAGDSLELADGALVVVDKDRRVAVDEELVRRSHRRGVGGQALSAGRRAVEPGQRQLGSSAETHDRGRSHRGPGSVVWPARRCRFRRERHDTVHRGAGVAAAPQHEWPRDESFASACVGARGVITIRPKV